MTWTPQDAQNLQRIASALADIRDVLVEATTPGLGLDAPASEPAPDDEWCPAGCPEGACVATFGSPCQR